jgi:2-keto-3-deoxy-L-rhamnonate aldolase RhmA
VAVSDGAGSRSFRERLRSGEVLLGTFLNLGSPLAAEACALAGYDWLLVDLEHGATDEGALAGQVLAAEAHQLPMLVRVETRERIRVGKALDLGAAGVMFPRLAALSEVQESVAHLRYPPSGDRGVAAYTRSGGFGRHPEALKSANDLVVGIVQVETAALLGELDEVASVDGLDAIFVGPSDLSYALGGPGRLDAPEFLHALERVVKVASAAGVAAGVMTYSPEAAHQYIERGFTLVAVGSDSGMLARAAAESVAAVREALR